MKLILRQNYLHSGIFNIFISSHLWIRDTRLSRIKLNFWNVFFLFQRILINSLEPLLEFKTQIIISGNWVTKKGAFSILPISRCNYSLIELDFCGADNRQVGHGLLHDDASVEMCLLWLSLGDSDVHIEDTWCRKLVAPPVLKSWACDRAKSTKKIYITTLAGDQNRASSNSNTAIKRSTPENGIMYMIHYFIYYRMMHK